MTFNVFCPHYQMLGTSAAVAHAVVFLQTLEYKPSEQNQQGISWIELFILFEMWGGIASDIDSNRCNPSLARKTLKSELANFKKLIRHVASLVLPLTQAMLFGPSKIGEFRLAPVGISSFVPCVRLNLALFPHDAEQLMLALLTLRLNMSFNRRNQLSLGTLYIPGRKVNYHACPSWRRHIVATSYIPEGAMRIIKAAFDLDLTFRARPDDAKVHLDLRCPKCPFVKNVGNINLYNDSKKTWNILHCPDCRKGYSSRTWMCPCAQAFGLPWISCKHHCPIGFWCKSQKRKLVSSTDHLGAIVPYKHNRQTGSSRFGPSFSSLVRPAL